ncbi:HAD hydrolase-like protein [Streptomyces rugosispiralis]
MNTRPRRALRDTRLVIFDCDGVLVDTERIGPAIVAEMATEVGWPLTPAQVRQRFLGRPESYLYEQVRAHATVPLGPDWLGVYRNRVRDAFAARPHTMPGVRELLDFLDLRQLPYCVASSGSHERIEHSLTATGLIERFTGKVFSADDVPRGKPAPDLFLHAAHSQGCPLPTASSSRTARPAWTPLSRQACPPSATAAVPPNPASSHTPRSASSRTSRTSWTPRPADEPHSPGAARHSGSGIDEAL